MTEQTVTATPEPEAPASAPEVPVSAPETAAGIPAAEIPATAPPVPGAPPAAPPQGPKPPRRVLRAVARWTAAVLVLGSVGTGTALGLASMERTDVPGLATEGDGRWDYPTLSLPALPAGSPRPFSDGNPAEVHHADLRKLLLPAPAGATADKKLTGDWVPTGQFLAEFREDKRDALSQLLKDSALRHIAARGWTMPDGTVSRTYLLRFNSAGFAGALRDDLYVGVSAGIPIAGTDVMELDESWNAADKVPGVTPYVFSEKAPFGGEHVRQAYSVAGDTLALVIHTRKGKEETARIPFQQSLILQNQLLG
ncbi:MULTISPECIES: hypothetical protein [unclassified Streptomyces]|uniref:hypothetical protein n=1 Tax=unclassified Streptomyces TaxID=2593676 RepID=UPI000939A512|nr:hypothetical protein [Streptomyces sp. TSRI0281]OKI45380.1 hypothetical protein A6A29_32715 [Streptomyces sp. TSRI0281]